MWLGNWGGLLYSSDGNEKQMVQIPISVSGSKPSHMDYKISIRSFSGETLGKCIH